MKSNNRAKISLSILLLNLLTVKICADDGNANISNRYRLVLALLGAYILMMVCLVAIAKVKENMANEKKKTEEKELKPWEKPNKYTNFPFGFFDRKEGK